MDEQNLKSLFKLASIPKISSSRIRNLISYFKTPYAVFQASPTDLCRVELIDKIKADAILNADNDAFVQEQIENINKTRTKAITLWDTDYPQQLKNILYPPVILFIRGNLIDEDKKAVAIVGTRNISPYGTECAKYFSKNLIKENITVISGLAYGIDTHAHQTAIESGGRTIAVLGSGVDIIYPAANNKLAEKIINQGALISEYLLGTKPIAQNFPARNRIISGMSVGVIIIESDSNGGAMITAQFALDQNREVFSVPGNINSKKSKGTNKLIKEGKAKLVQNIDDVLCELNLKIKAPEKELLKPKDLQLTLEESKIFDFLRIETKHIDTISDETGMSTSETLVTLLNLELKGLVRQLPGKLFQCVE